MANNGKQGGRYLGTVLLGAVIILILTPLAQVLTIMTVNSAAETSTPLSWAMGIVISLVLVGLSFGAVLKLKLFSAGQLAVLYTMLTIAVPLMNIGLVRPAYLASVSVLREYLYEGTSTYRTAYSALNENWAPVVPTVEGLAWSETQQLVQNLYDRDRLREEQVARRAVYERLGTIEVEDIGAWAEVLPMTRGLRIEELRALRATPEMAAAPEAVLQTVDGQIAQRVEASAEALAYLETRLAEVSWWVASIQPDRIAQLSISDRRRLERAAEVYLDVADRTALDAAVKALSADIERVRAALTALSAADLERFKGAHQGRLEERYSQLDTVALAKERESHVYRLSRDDRRLLIQQDGQSGPNQNLWAFQFSYWGDVSAKQAKAQAGLWENLGLVIERLPWQLWLKPMALWGFLFLCIFAFLMALAELLRRKWVDRENLAFPLVDIADNIIRHDMQLETASDPCEPEARTRTFHPFMLIGIAIGFLLLTAEALYHYGLVGSEARLYLNLNQSIFSPIGGIFRSVGPMVFVISPIVVGIGYLLSLQLSFSIWVMFLIVTLVQWIVLLSNPEIKDSMYTGFSGGKNYPFWMEQLVGAALCYVLYLLWKTFRGGGSVKAEAAATVPPQAGMMNGRLAVGLLVGMPVIAGALLWNLGVQSLAFIGLFGGIILVTTIAAARIRAESGLPQAHVHYEMTKMPLIFGLTEGAGAKVYAAFLNVVFLPGTLLMRTLPQTLENLELARRLRISYAVIAGASLVAFAVALVVGGFSFLVLAYYLGSDFYAATAFPVQSSQTAVGLATYPLWVSHFLGEAGLGNYGDVNTLRLVVMGIGFLVTGALILLRQKFMNFPLHPIGYLVVLFSVYFAWCTQYVGVEIQKPEGSLLWGGVLVAWFIKKMVLKYGGMNTYKQSKPLFIGLVIGAVLAIFAWNSLDLIASLWAAGETDPGPFLRNFTETVPYMPAVY